MQITTTPFNHHYRHSQLAGNATAGRYIIHNIDVSNTLIIDGIELNAVYQCGVSYNNNDLGCPNPKLELSPAGGTSDVLLLINRLYDTDFEFEASILATLEDVKALCPAIDSVKKLKAVYDELNDNLPILAYFLDADEYTDDPADYLEDGDTGFLIPDGSRATNAPR